MLTYESTFFSTPTLLVRVARAAVGVVVAGLVVAAWSTAGPGNYDREAVARVSLPQVTVVGHRDDAAQVTTASATGCARSQLDGRTGRKLS